MAGIPPLSGYWSKEEILMAACSFAPPVFPAAGKILLFVGLAAAFLTAFYISRAVILTFAGSAREESRSHAHESPLVMTGPLIILSLGAIGVGLLGSPWGGHWFQQFLDTHAAHHEGMGAIGVISVAVASVGIGAALLRYGFNVQLLPAGLRTALGSIHRVVHHKYYVDELYEKILIRPALALARAAFQFDQKAIDGAVNGAGEAGLSLSRLKGWFDSTIVDGAVNGIGITFSRTGSALRLIQTGFVQNYLLIALSGAVTIFLLLRWVL
jgi:NADH-quinone oxidoreductase subunit L